jgi:hypothetical protein
MELREAGRSSTLLSVASRPTDSCALLPDTHQSRAARNPPQNRSEGYFTFTFNYLPQLRTLATAVGMALAL